MNQVSGRPTSNNWDIEAVEGAAGRAAMAETFAAHAFGLALTFQDPEFFEQVDRLRAGADLWAVARGYVRRDQGRRVEAIATFLRRAVEVGPSRPHVKTAVWNTGRPSWWVDAPLEPGQPQRQLRREAIETIAVGAVRVARRGLSRCVDPMCSDGRGAVLRTGVSRDYCGPCSLREDRRPRDELEAERVFFDALIPAVLGGESRPRARRLRRAA